MWRRYTFFLKIKSMPKIIMYKNKKYRIELNKSKINYIDFYTNNPYKYLEKNKVIEWLKSEI